MFTGLGVSCALFCGFTASIKFGKIVAIISLNVFLFSTNPYYNRSLNFCSFSEVFYRSLQVTKFQFIFFKYFSVDSFYCCVFKFIDTLDNDSCKSIQILYFSTVERSTWILIISSISCFNMFLQILKKLMIIAVFEDFVTNYIILVISVGFYWLIFLELQITFFHHHHLSGEF